MPTDERSAHNTGGHQFASDPGRIHERPGDEFDDTAERVGNRTWEHFETDPGDRLRSRTEREQRDEPGAIVTFLEGQLRERPIPTLIAAVAAGWLVGKILR